MRSSVPQVRLVATLLTLASLTCTGCGQGNPIGNGQAPGAASSSGKASSGTPSSDIASSDIGSSDKADFGKADSDMADAGKADSGMASVYDYGERPSAEEALVFAQAFEAAISNDAAAANSMIDLPLLLQLVTSNVDVDPKFREGYLEEAQRSSAIEGLTSRWAALVQEGGNLSLLRVHEVDGERRALVRVLQADGTLNYLDFVLVRLGQEVKAADFYIFLSGEKISQTMRRLYLAAAADLPSSFLDRLTGREGDFIKHDDKIANMAKSLRMGGHQQVLDIYHEMPPSLQQEKAIMLYRVLASAQLDEQLYGEAIDAFRAAHPDDPCIDFISMDGLLMRGSYDEAMQAVSRLDESLGGDPYLNILRSNIHLMQGQVAEARQAAEKAMQGTPDLEDVYWQLVSISLAEENYSETARLLTKLQEKFQIEIANLSTIEAYAGFVHSPEYKQWLKARSN
jgi:tetratricopeptide (TPR) repeat protein